MDNKDKLTDSLKEIEGMINTGNFPVKLRVKDNSVEFYFNDEPYKITNNIHEALNFFYKFFPHT